MTADLISRLIEVCRLASNLDHECRDMILLTYLHREKVPVEFITLVNTARELYAEIQDAQESPNGKT